jgi:hypothetical protein
MELLNPLRLLARRRRILAIGALMALAMGLAASGSLPFGPLASPERRSAVATAEIQIDTLRPLAADLRASTATIAEQSMMLGERLAADDTRTFIARRAGVPVRDLLVLSSRTVIVGRSSPVARAAVDAGSSAQSRFRLTVSSLTDDTPILSIEAAAPDRATAAGLAAAAAPALELVIDAAPESVRKRLEVKPLAAPRTASVVSGGPRPLLGVLAALFGFVGWCWCVVVAGGAARLWRTSMADPLARRA